MKSTTARKLIVAASWAMVLTFTVFAVNAQDKPADNMQILEEKVKADKKLVVANNMGLTESEAKAFWPIYDAYQKDLAQLNDRLIQYEHAHGAFRGIRSAARRQAFVEQLIDSVRRVQYVTTIQTRDVASGRGVPYSPLFEPLKARRLRIRWDENRIWV